MRAVIQSIAQETQVRDRQGQVLTTFKGKVFTLILQIFLVGLFLLAITGILGFLILWTMQG
jgi:hypothetical protein